MAFNGTGTFLRIYNWVTDKVNAIPITASRFDAELDGMATGLSNCITKDGQTTISANIPLNSFKLTGLGVGTARTDAINVGQVQDNQFLYLGTTAGTADAYTLAPSPAITAYTATQQFTAKISATNLTITPYLQVSSIANPATTAVIKKLSATKTEVAVEASDLLINGIYNFKRNSANDAWIVLNPEKAFYNLLNATKATTITQGVVFRKNPTIQKFASGSGTYTTASSDVLYIQAILVGGGGGGAGSGASGGTGSTGGATTFGTSLLVANGGIGGAVNGAIGGDGGSASLGTGPIGTALGGGFGQAGFTSSAVGSSPCGGFGGTTVFGGAGSGGNGNGGGVGGSAKVNTGAGGGGAGGSSTTTFAGAGGGAGGFIKAIIESPSSTYAYSIGAGGAGGSAGTSGFGGGSGSTGYIEITEFYN